MKGKTFAERTGGPLAEAGLLILAAGTPLCLGSVHRPTILAATLVAVFTVLALWTHRRATGRGLRVGGFGAVLLGLTAFTAFQLVPLPLALLRWIAPATVEVLEVSLAGAGVGLPARHAISLDPPSTLIEVLKIGTCTLAFIAAQNFFHRSDRQKRLLAVLVATGVISTLVGFVGAVVAPGRPLIVFSQAMSPGGLIATSFVNPNHGSAFLTVAAVLAVGLAVAARDLQRRVLLGLAATLLGSGVFLTLSRGGMLALALALAVLAVLLAARGAAAASPLGERPVAWRVAILPGTMALILALSAWLAYDAILAELKPTAHELVSGLGKIALWPRGLDMVLANLFVGVGRGAFLTTFPRYLRPEGLPLDRTYSHLENQYLHLPAELGLLVGAGVIAASVVALVVWIRRGRPDARILAGAAALVALAGHAVFDFNLELLGIAVPAALIAGLIAASSSASKHRDATRSRPVDPSDEIAVDERDEGDESLEGKTDPSVETAPSAGTPAEGKVAEVASTSAVDNEPPPRDRSRRKSHRRRGFHPSLSGLVLVGVLGVALALAALIVASETWISIEHSNAIWGWIAFGTCACVVLLLARAVLSRRRSERTGTALVLAVATGLVLLAARVELESGAFSDDDLAGIPTLAESSTAKALAAVQRAIRRHPADYLPHLVGARILLRDKRPAALAWLNRALFLFPHSPALHIETARTLARFGRRRQALLEYRLSLESGAPLAPLLATALPLARNSEEVLLLLPPVDQVHAAASIALVASGRTTLARSVVVTAKRRFPSSTAVAIAEIEVLLAVSEFDTALAHARSLARAHSSSETSRIWANAALRAGQPRVAVDVLTRARLRDQKDEALAFALAGAHLEGKEYTRAIQIAEEILEQASSLPSLAAAHDLLSRIHSADGRPHRARYEAEQAQKIREGR